MSQNKRLIVIAGPTAVGKTSFAIRLAQHYNTQIVSCDSRQLYKELNIGVARPSEEELQAVKHHFILSHSIYNDYNAGIYEVEANQLLADLFKQYATVIMTGGTGLYIKAATQGLDPLPKKNKLFRTEMQSLELSEIQALSKEFGISAEDKSWDNPQRLIRAIEIKKFAEGKSSKAVNRNYNVQYYYLNRPREELYSRINKRVELMIDNGLEEEAKSLYPHRHLNALQTVGYKELFKYFNQEWTKAIAIDKVKQHTRNYAKRQLTWFRNQDEYIEINFDIEALIKKIG